MAAAKFAPLAGAGAGAEAEKGAGLAERSAELPEVPPGGFARLQDVEEGRPAAKKSHRLLGLFLVALSAVSFSVMSLFASLAGNTFQSFQIALVRAVLSGAFNLAALLWRREPVWGPPSVRRTLVWRGVFGSGGMLSLYYALVVLPLADASVLFFTAPVWTMLLAAAMLKEPIHVVDAVASVTALAGVALVARPSFLFPDEHHEDEHGRMIGVVVALAGSLSAAGAFICIRRLAGAVRVDPLVIIHYFMCVLFVCALVGTAAQGWVWPSAPSEWLLLLGVGVLGFLGQVVMTLGFQLEKAGPAAIMRYLDVACVFLWDYLFIPEDPIHTLSIVGALLICGGAVASTVHRSRRQAQAPAPAES